MYVLMLSTDAQMLDPQSATFARTKAYARCLGELDVIVFTTGSKRNVIAGSLRIFPTDSVSKLFYGWSALRIARALPAPDVVTAQDPFETGLAGYFIAKRANAPLHVQVHTDLFSPEYRRHSLINRLRLVLAQFIIPRASGVRAVSERIRRDIEQRFRIHSPVSVLPIYVDIERFRFALPDPALAERFARCAPKVLVVARLEPEKNVALAIRAFAESAPEKACLIVVGDGSERSMLYDLAKKLDVERRVFFENMRDPAPYYKLADLVLVTSQYEGYGRVIVEALAAGKPVIATDAGAARELGAIIAPPEDFARVLAEWFQHGRRESHVANYLYKNFDAYVRAYCGDIVAAVDRNRGMK